MSSKSDSNYFDDSSSLQPTKRAWPFEEIVNEEQKAKKNRTEVILSIWTALESEQPQHGILNYFKKATDSERAAYQARMAEDIAMRMEEKGWREGKAKQTKRALIQRQAKERKQAQRRREKDREILAGLRSPGGTKRRVSLDKFTTFMDFTNIEFERPDL